jgi:hypothetical protein
MMNLESMFKTTAFLTLVLVITVFNVAQAAEKVIAVVHNEESGLKYRLIIEDKDGRGIKALYKDVYKGNEKLKRDLLDVNTIATTGLVLEQRNDFELMKLKGLNFDLDQGGMVEIDTLYNGATKERKKYQVQFTQTQQGWAIIKDKKIIKDIFIKVNKVMFIGAVGIKSLDMQ